MLFLLFCSSVFCATAEVQDLPLSTTPRNQQQNSTTNKVSPPPSPPPLSRDLRLDQTLMEIPMNMLRSLELHLNIVIEKLGELRESRKRIVFQEMQA